jgi:hypothetical protein
MVSTHKRQQEIARKLFKVLQGHHATGKGSSGRTRTGAPLRRAFVLNTPSGPSPLVRMLNQRNGKSGGPGGGLRLQTYLSLLWVCSGSPYQSQRPARVWAELLSLEDPEINGTRRIRATLKELQERRFIDIEPTKPTPTIKLLSDLGDGSPYVPPGIAMLTASAEDKPSNEYFRVPNDLWLDGYIADMSGAALAMFLVLLAESRGTRKDVWLSPKALEALYGISPSTRTKGISALEDLGLITVRRQAVISTIEYSPSRQVYQLPMLPIPEQGS